MSKDDFRQAPIYPSRLLTVVIRDDSPMIFCDDSPAYRSVQITLTDEQVSAMALRWVGSTGGTHIHESVSKCFIEPKIDAAPQGATQEGEG